MKHLNEICIQFFFAVTVFLDNILQSSSNERNKANIKLQIRIHYAEQNVFYHPSFMNIMKMAWIQYLSLYVIFWWLFHKLKNWLFENQICMTVPSELWKNSEFH